ncbi:Ig-like domain-containing protein [Streptomyces sp. NPDC088197]|uniref:Ig-like domain-containing protein n=1 Tax=Streptomyces sp. NPDC088197 TaxID=3365840 RepID=UPI003819FB2D
MGDPTKTNLWTNADVYVSPLGTANPATVTAPWPVGWGQTGLLAGDDGMPESRDEDVSDMYAWGGILVRTSRKNFKLTKKFSALEDNVTTRALIWPGSTETQIVVPRPSPVKIGFETRDPSTGKIERLITRNYGLITLDGDRDINETDLTKAVLAAVIYPDANGVLFDRQAAPTLTALAVAPGTLALSVGAAKKLVATATYSDSSTSDVTGLASWSSSAPAKATVEYGYVTAVAAGTSNVTATYGGITSSASAVTVS